MDWRSTSSAALAVGATLLGACAFQPDTGVDFVQQPVPPLKLGVVVDRNIGADIEGVPRLALVYDEYFDPPPHTIVEPIAALPAFPAVAVHHFQTPLTTERLNRGFAHGFGNFVLGVGYLAVFDDLNNDGVKEDGEAWIGASADTIVVYFQGTLTPDLVDQFGALTTGYNICGKVGRARGVDLFRPDNGLVHTATLAIPKSRGDVFFPVVR